VRAASLFLVVLMVVVPLVVMPGLREAFRLPKEVVGTALALAASLVLVVARALSSPGAWVDGPPTAEAQLLRWRRLGLGSVVAFVAIAALGWWHSAHPERVAAAARALLAALLPLAVWSTLLDRARLVRVLDWSILPGVVLSGVGLAQALGAYQPFDFVVVGMSARESVTSLAGNPGDFSAFLILPLLAAAVRASQPSRFRGWWLAAAVVIFFGLLAGQTITSLVAAAVGGSVVAARIFGVRRTVTVLAAALVLGAGLAAVWGPLRTRVDEKVTALVRGDLNDLLTGRLDGWRAAVHLGREAPWTGVGLGCYGAEFTRARLELMDQGVAFYPRHTFSTFGNAHNELLEVFAETGVPGLLAVLLGLAALGGLIRRSWADPAAAVPIAFVAAVLVLAMTNFPMRIAITSWPAVVALAALAASDREQA
jgi:O-antigen ligase